MGLVNIAGRRELAGKAAAFSFALLSRASPRPSPPFLSLSRFCPLSLSLSLSLYPPCLPAACLHPVERHKSPPIVNNTRRMLISSCRAGCSAHTRGVRLNVKGNRQVADLWNLLIPSSPHRARLQLTRFNRRNACVSLKPTSGCELPRRALAGYSGCEYAREYAPRVRSRLRR